MDKLLSIIIPVYNVEKYIAKCLQSILIENRESLEEMEVIVVDDGSTDKSGGIADRFAIKYKCMCVIHKKNEGVAAARNTGIRNAHGKWLYFVDSDDWMEKGGVGSICGELRKNPEVDVLFMEAYENVGRKQKGWEHFDAERVVTKSEELTRMQCGILYAPFWSKAGGVPMAAPWDKVYRREFITENNLSFCGHLKVLDDMVFNFEVFGAAKAVACTKIKPYHYRRVADSITNSYKPDRVVQDMAVWRYLLSLDIWGSGQSEMLRRALMCRIVKSFSICCRLCFFHPNNEKHLVGKIVYVKKVMGRKPYHMAFRAVRLSDLEWQLKIMTLAGRLHSGVCVYLLHEGRRLLFRHSYR